MLVGITISKYKYTTSIHNLNLLSVSLRLMQEMILIMLIVLVILILLLITNCKFNYKCYKYNLWEVGIREKGEATLLQGFIIFE